MTDFDVTFQEQFRFTKTEFLVILSNMQDQNGADLTDEAGLPVMIHRIGSSKRDYIRCWSDSALMVLLRRLSRWCAMCDLQILLGGSIKVRTLQGFQIHVQYGQQAILNEYFPAFVSTCVTWGSLSILVSFSSMEISRKHADRAVCFVRIFASVYRLCVKISNLFSLLRLLAPCGAGDGMSSST